MPLLQRLNPLTRQLMMSSVNGGFPSLQLEQNTPPITYLQQVAHRCNDVPLLMFSASALTVVAIFLTLAFLLRCKQSR
jgi:hypothetical protein